MQYIVISAILGDPTFHQRITALLGKGWELHGSFTMNQTYMAQAMIKRPDLEQKEAK